MRDGFSILFAALVVLNAATIQAAAPARLRSQVIQMTVADGKLDDPGRVFWVPVVCNGVEANFELGGFGPSRISESFARECRVSIFPDSQLDRSRDPEGKTIFLGAAILH